MASFPVDMSFELKTCPYDSNHRVKASKYQSHIANCAKRANRGNLCVCPFNRNHCVEKDKYADHLMRCSDGLQELRNMTESKAERSVASSAAIAGNSRDKSPERDLWLDEYETDNNDGEHEILDVLKKDTLTAEEMMQLVGQNNTFGDSIYLSRMPYEERRKYYQMLVDRVKPAIDVNDVNDANDDNDFEPNLKNKSADDVSEPFRPPRNRPFMPNEKTEESLESKQIGFNERKNLGIGRGNIKKNN